MLSDPSACGRQSFAIPIADQGGCRSRLPTDANGVEYGSSDYGAESQRLTLKVIYCLPQYADGDNHGWCDDTGNCSTVYNPGQCQVCTSGDFAHVGNTNLVDCDSFNDCFAGTFDLPVCDPPLYADLNWALLDFHGDGAVDTSAYGLLQLSYRGIQMRRDSAQPPTPPPSRANPRLGGLRCPIPRSPPDFAQVPPVRSRWSALLCFLNKKGTSRKALDNHNQMVILIEWPQLL